MIILLSFFIYTLGSVLSLGMAQRLKYKDEGDLYPAILMFWPVFVIYYLFYLLLCKVRGYK